jgi:hypothetical protein
VTSFLYSSPDLAELRKRFDEVYTGDPAREEYWNSIEIRWKQGIIQVKEAEVDSLRQAIAVLRRDLQDTIERADRMEHRMDVVT